MPYVLLREATGQLCTCMLVNHYDLPYYGLKYWKEEASALEEKDAFLVSLGLEKKQTAEWRVILMSEEQMKLGNVKVKNDPSYLLTLADGKLTAEKI